MTHIKTILSLVFMCSTSLVEYTLALSTPGRPTTVNADTFDTFIEMRLGLGSGGGASDMVFWVGEGQLYDSPSGKILANIDGIDVARGIKIGEKHVRQFSRKIFWYRDPKTNQIMKEFNGKPVRPIKYDWQVFDYKQGVNENDPSMAPILMSVLKSRRVVPCMPIVPRSAGNDQIMYQCPLFIDVETNEGRYQAWEVYDYFLDTSFNKNRPPSVAWSRQGPNPPFDENEEGVLHIMGHRLTSFEDLPEQVRTLVEEDFPLFQAAPENMEEVERLESLMVNGNS